MYARERSTFITDSDLCIRNVRELGLHPLSEGLRRKVSWVDTRGHVHVCIQLVSACSQEAPQAGNEIK